MTDEWLRSFEERTAERAKTDRTFTLLGEELTVKASVAPEVGLRIAAMRQTVSEDLDAARAARATGDPITQDRVTDQEMIDLGDATVLACLEPGSHEAWRRLRSVDHPTPLRLADIFALCDYLIGRCSGHPTVGPAASPTGPTKTEASSTDASSSPAPKRKRSR